MFSASDLASDLLDEFLQGTKTQPAQQSSVTDKPARPALAEYRCKNPEHGVFRVKHGVTAHCPACRDMRPNPMLDRLRHIRDRRVEHCETHGAYASMLIAPPGASTHWTGCMDCVQDREAAETAAKMQADRRLAKLARSKRLETVITVPDRYRLESLDSYVPQTEQQATVLNNVWRYVGAFSEHAEVGRGFVMTGQPGTGKTHLSYGIMKALQERGKTVACLNLSEFYGHFKATFGKGGEGGGEMTEDKVFEAFVSVDLLILDEIGQDGDEYGAKELSAWRHTTLFDVIDRRNKSNRPTAVVTNRDPRQLATILGAAIISRVNQSGAKLFALDGSDYRARQ